MKVVVSDTGPILHLREAGVLEVLQHAGEIVIPAGVDDELLRIIDDWPAIRPSWLKRRTLDATARITSPPVTMSEPV